MNPFGFTRSVIARNHTVNTPESHVAAPLSGCEKTQCIKELGRDPVGMDHVILSVFILAT
jgi:hypothetical protein